MIGVALRGLLNRKLRTVLTAIAIVLGVSMISGTFILTDTIDNAFNQIFKTANSSTDAIVVGVSSANSLTNTPPPFPASLLSVVRHTPGVAVASGEVQDQVQVLDTKGKSLTPQGAPGLLFSRVAPRLAALTLVSGRYPTGREIDLDTYTVARSKLRVGDTVSVVAERGLIHVKVVGTVKLGNAGSLGGAAILLMDTPEAQYITDKTGEYDQIRVGAASGVTPTDLVYRIRARIPPALAKRVKVVTGQQNAQQAANGIANALSSLTDILLAFGAIALFVGAFVIFNTFSITVAQRIREFALLRTLGATRRQVLTSVLLEALAVGLLSSILGLFAGIGIAKGMNALFKRVGADLPTTNLAIETRTVVVALVVGTLVTLLSSLMPAIRATRVPPIAALREGFQLPRGRLARLTPLLAAGLGLLGLVLLAIGIFASISSTSTRITLIGAGCLGLFLGAAIFSPQLVRPMAAVIGWPIERFTRITGRLARGNAVRNPNRTAVTAAALMIGLAVVGFVTIFAAELKQTADDEINRELAGTYAIYNDSGRFIPSGVGPAVARVPGVAAVSSLKIDAGRLAGIGVVQTNGMQFNNVDRVYHFQWVHAPAMPLSHMGANDALIDDSMAKNHHLGIGSVLHATTPSGRTVTFHVAGVYKTTQLLPDWCIPYATMRADWNQQQDYVVLVEAASGQNIAQLKARLTALMTARFPTAAVHTQQDLRNQNDKGINQLLTLIYVLLAMSVLVSLFGIINTLVLSVYERTREIGMLRAIGATRGQVRWMVRWESVITSVIGAVLGLVLGVILAALVTAGLRDQGLEFTLPFVQLLIWVVFAMIFGIVAAAWPARRAARLDVLQAVSYE